MSKIVLMKTIVQININQKWYDCVALEFDSVNKSFETNVVLDYEMKYFDQFAHFLDDQTYYCVSSQIQFDLSHHHFSSWPSFLFDLIPQGSARKSVCKRLGIADIPENDLKILVGGAQNPVGHLRIKNTFDLFENTKSIDFSLDDIANKKENFLEEAYRLNAIVIGGSGAQGMAPKFLINKNKNKAYSIDGALREELIEESYIIKLPKFNKANDIKILKAEKYYMDIAIELGLHTHKPLELYKNMLVIKRFDRLHLKTGFTRLGYESMSSLLGDTDFGLRHHIEECLECIKKYSTHWQDDVLEFIMRDLLNIALGNTDNHARNHAFIKYPDQSMRLSPLFDFAPMCLDEEGIIRVIRWKEEESSIPEFDYSKKFLLGLGLEIEQINDFFNNALIKIKSIKSLNVIDNIDKEITEQAFEKMQTLIKALEKSKELKSDKESER